MVADPNEIYYFMASYIGIIVLVVGFIAWWLSGFLGPYVRVKTSRGKLVLVCEHGALRTDWRAGRVQEAMLKYKPRGSKEFKLISITPTMVYRSMGVNCVEVDGITNVAFSRDNYAYHKKMLNAKGEAVDAVEIAPGIKGGHDAVRTDNMITRALMLPRLGDNQMKVVLVIVVIIAIILIANVFYSVQTYNAVTYIAGRVGNLTAIPRV